MINQIEFSLRARQRGCHLITAEVEEKLGQLPKLGMVQLFLKHTSCALSLNENFDPDVRTDLADSFGRIAPESATLYRHSDEGLDDMPAHIVSSLVGVSLTIPITNHRLNLGTWQGIYLCEARNYGGSRRMVATIFGE